MIEKIRLLFMVLYFAAGSIPSFSQNKPHAYAGGIQLEAGGGVSDYSIDSGPGLSMEGVNLWGDADFKTLPSVFSGLGLQFEGRDIRWGEPSGVSIHRMDTVTGGAIYTWKRHRAIHPYAKYLIGKGSIDFAPEPATPNYKHDTRTVYAPGFGGEFHAFRNTWVRADYEYQFWPKLFGFNSLNPNGITLGVTYKFGSMVTH
jgi:hypothetical protein